MSTTTSKITDYEMQTQFTNSTEPQSRIQSTLPRFTATSSGIGVPGAFDCFKAKLKPFEDAGAPASSPNKKSEATPLNLSRLGASGTGERNFANNLRYIESSERLLVSGEDKSDARGYSTANMANYQGRGVLIELGEESEENNKPSEASTPLKRNPVKEEEEERKLLPPQEQNLTPLE